MAYLNSNSAGNMLICISENLHWRTCACMTNLQLHAAAYNWQLHASFCNLRLLLKDDCCFLRHPLLHRLSVTTLQKGRYATIADRGPCRQHCLPTANGKIEVALQDGSMFKSQIPFSPYLYLQVKVNSQSA